MANKRRTKTPSIGCLFLVLIVFCIIAVPWAQKDEHYTSRTGFSSYGYSPSRTATPRTGKSGALAQALIYLQLSAFSYTGLIEQLEYHGYTTSEATYAVNNCSADWSFQALKKAKVYLNTSAFSYMGLVEQLEYEGYTASQARYGASNCGADWKEQAVKKANTYLRLHSWTKYDLIAQLEYEKFTSSEAKYGVEHSNIN